jgi:hypothetical protein
MVFEECFMDFHEIKVLGVISFVFCLLNVKRPIHGTFVFKKYLEFHVHHCLEVLV